MFRINIHKQYTNTMGLFGPLEGIFGDASDGFHSLTQLLKMTVKYLPYMMILAGMGMALQTVKLIKNK